MKFYGRMVYCLFVFVASFAQGKSLDDVLAAQTTIEISPVEVEGLPITGDARSICAMLGYSRLVKFQARTCKVGERLGIISGDTAYHVIYANENCYSDGSDRRSVYTSVTCAK